MLIEILSNGCNVVNYCCCYYCRDDEHLLIQHYCQSLNQGSPLSQPQSPAQILISMETEEKGELERVLNDLEQENRFDCMTAFFTIQMIGFKMKCNVHKTDCVPSAYFCHYKLHSLHHIFYEKCHALDQWFSNGRLPTENVFSENAGLNANNKII